MGAAGAGAGPGAVAGGDAGRKRAAPMTPGAAPAPGTIDRLEDTAAGAEVASGVVTEARWARLDAQIEVYTHRGKHGDRGIKMPPRSGNSAKEYVPARCHPSIHAPLSEGSFVDVRLSSEEEQARNHPGGGMRRGGHRFNLARIHSYAKGVHRAYPYEASKKIYRLQWFTPLSQVSALCCWVGGYTVFFFEQPESGPI